MRSSSWACRARRSTTNSSRRAAVPIGRRRGQTPRLRSRRRISPLCARGLTPQATLARAEGTEAIAILDGIRHRFTVPPGGHVVDAALAAGIRVPYSCKGGMCCTCRARLVEGQAEMTTNYSLSPGRSSAGSS